MNTELLNKLVTTVQGSRPELGTRIGRVAEKVGGQARTAEMMGVSLSQLKRYIAGTNQATFDAVAKLSQNAGVCLDWLAFGDEPMLVSERCRGQAQPAPSATSSGQPILDELLMTVVISTTENWLERQKLDVKPDEKAKLFLAIYRLMLRKRAEVADKEGLSSRVKEIASDLIGSFS